MAIKSVGEKYDSNFILNYKKDITKRIEFLLKVCEDASKIKKDEI